MKKRRQKLDHPLADEIARKHGLCKSTVLGYWSLGRSLDKVGTGCSTAQKTAEIDLGLAVLNAIIPEGIPLSRNLIGDVCGSSGEAIRQIELKAMKKLRENIPTELHQHLRRA